MKYDKFFEDQLDLMGDDHIGSSSETPIRDNAFVLSDDEKISVIEKDIYNILETLGMDLNDDSLKGTPRRVAKMFVKELFGGLNPNKLPKSSTFKNKYDYYFPIHFKFIKELSKEDFERILFNFQRLHLLKGRHS